MPLYESEELTREDLDKIRRVTMRALRERQVPMRKRD